MKNLQEKNRLPVLYIPHGGGPCFFMDWTMGPADTWDKMAAWLRGISVTVSPKPKAILVVSAHWEAEVVTVTSHPKPPLLYDYYGFPAHTYELKYPAPGAPSLAGKIAERLKKAGIASQLDEKRGLDHGVFVPFKLIYPEADIPVLQISLKKGMNPAEHIAIGKVLETLRDEGVLIVGSGMSYHNLGNFMRRQGKDSEGFDAWLTETVESDVRTRDEKLAKWTEAPKARECHPREEHLIPLMVCAGAAGGDVGRRIFTDVVMGSRISAYAFG